MKKNLLIITLTTLFSLNIMAQEPKTKADSVSYAIGFNIGSNLAGESFAFSIDAITAGMKAAFEKSTPAMTPEEMNAVLQAWQEEMQNAQMATAEQASAENKTKGTEFLAKNKTKKGVQTTASGLQYEVVKEGKGAHPKATDQVKVHYKGTLIDGTTFDSSYDRGEPITFGLNQVIAGWTEGLQLMTPGAKYMLYIPSDLGYGDRPVSIIPAGSTLIFEVELLEINPKE